LQHIAKKGIEYRLESIPHGTRKSLALYHAMMSHGADGGGERRNPKRKEALTDARAQPPRPYDGDFCHWRRFRGRRLRNDGAAVGAEPYPGARTGARS
jgi:hypothetical protein